MSSTTAILAGATGLVGGLALDLLLERYDRVLSVGRRKSGRTHVKLTEHDVDFDRLEDHGEALVGEDCFCCLGTTLRAAGSRDAFARVDRDYVVALARQALDRGAQRFFLVSALGADASSGVFYNRIKGEAEDAVAALPFAAVHIVRPSLILGARSDKRPAERVGQWFGRLAGPLFVGPLARYRAIDARDVAEALIHSARAEASGVHIHYPGVRETVT